MGNGETYIKMCDCPEIQSTHTWGDGDFYWWSLDKQIHISYTARYDDYIVQSPEAWDSIGDRRVIWLPRQDQIQEMLHGYFLEVGCWEGSIILQAVFSGWIRDNGGYLIKSGLNKASMEQLWLAFLMKEKYSKTWSGKEWV